MYQSITIPLWYVKWLSSTTVVIFVFFLMAIYPYDKIVFSAPLNKYINKGQLYFIRVSAHGAMDTWAIVPVLHNCISKGCGMYYPVYGMVHIKDTLPLIRKTSSCSGRNGFPLLLSECFFTKSDAI